MEQILIRLQQLQLEAFRRGVSTFNVAFYNWDDPEFPATATVWVVRDGDDSDGYRGTIHSGDSREFEKVVMQIKLYLSL